MTSLLKTIRLLPILLCSQLYAQPPGHCECIWQGAFVDIIDQADFIVSGTITARKGNSADFAIQRVLQNNTSNPKEFRQQVRVWGNDGKRCRPEMDSFELDSQWLLALKKITTVPADGFNPNTPNVSFGRENDYFLSSCGGYWLGLKDGYVFGPLAKAKRWQWQDEDMNPVLIDLVDAYIRGTIPRESILEAAKPQTEAKRLMEATKNFLRDQ